MSRVSLVCHGLGIIIVYSSYGVLQEKIIKSTYGINQERFNSPSLLVFCNRVFAMVLAIIIIIALKRNGRGTSLSLSQALKPTSPLTSYATVAICNFLATTFQYQALSHLSFTTTSLSKCIKMIPVLIVQRVIYKQSIKMKDTVAALVISLGCFTYLSTVKSSVLESDAAFSDALLGGLFIGGYLFFDSLTSTFQEKYFGRNSSSTDPFGPESGILPQMIYVNFFASIFSLIGVLASFKEGNVPSSINLLIQNRSLQIDVLLLSLTASLGLIILLNSIASFGALWTSCLMTVRQFFGILVNAGIFSHFSSSGLEGWCGVGWVASGVFIKMNRSHDVVPIIKVTDEESHSFKDEKYETKRTSSPEPLQGANSNRSSFSEASEPTSNRRFIYQYLIPVLLPTVISFIVWICVPTGTGVLVDNVMLEGGAWEHELHSGLLPECSPSNASATIRWEGKRRTILASFPRSGNTLTRELVERATNFQTSTVSYCDEFLRESFIGECDHSAKFLSKSHYPWKLADNDLEYRKIQHYDAGVHLVRNPIDTLYSDWMLAHVPKLNGQLDHSGRIKIGLLGSTPDQRAFVLRRAAIWQHHDQYWKSIPIPIHDVRYEDLILDRLPTMLSLISFLLPNEEDRPDLNSISCMTELDEARQAYKSSKGKTFKAWDLWLPTVRDEVLEIVRLGWCREGYQSMFEELRPDRKSGIIC